MRELRFQVVQPGFRVDELVLVTTMVDAEVYSKEELADLFLERWNIELDFRSIKCALKMDILRCQSPEMVRKEIWMHLLAYNLIRGVMAQAAAAHGRAPRRVSFTGAWQTMKAFHDSLVGASPAERERLVAVMLKAIAGHRVGDRPGRVEPRATQAQAQEATISQRAEERGSQALDGQRLSEIRATFVSGTKERIDCLLEKVLSNRECGTPATA